MDAKLFAEKVRGEAHLAYLEGAIAFDGFYGYAPDPGIFDDDFQGEAKVGKLRFCGRGFFCGLRENPHTECLEFRYVRPE